jgi:FkbM family methyltransferase
MLALSFISLLIQFNWTTTMSPSEAVQLLQHSLFNLTHPIVIADLGSSGNAVTPLPDWFAKYAVSISIDALAPNESNGSIFSEDIVVSNLAVSDAIGSGTLIERHFSMCSGLNEVHQNEVAAYGIESFYQEVKRIDMATTTLPAILKEHGLSQIHYLKLDLEGSDLAVLDSCAGVLKECSLLQAELRNTPLYVGEKTLGESLTHINLKGFNLIDMKNEFWKRKTPNRHRVSHGNLAYSDAVFTRKIEPENDISIAIHALLLHFYGYTNLAEYWLMNQAMTDTQLRLALWSVLFDPEKLPQQPFNHAFFTHLALAR